MKRMWKAKRQLYKYFIILLSMMILFTVPAYATETASENEAEISPQVQITITKPDGWWNKNNAKVKISVKDIADSGNFTIASVKAAAGSSSSYVDITAEMYVEISENTTVYVLVTDSNGNNYSASKYIDCYDKTKPTLNAAVNNGLLTVQATDNDSGVKAIYVNQYEFTDMVNGVISIRMKKYDANYEYFTVQALDNAGNMSEVYKVKNPYYKNTNVTKTTTSGNTSSKSSTTQTEKTNPATTLPASVTPTPVTETPTGDVVEHVTTDEDGDVIEEEKKSEKAKEFFIINTKNGKEFYLVVDRTGDKETTYFLTGITDNDLLNVTGVTADELPENAAYNSTDDPYIVGLPNNSYENPEADEEAQKSGSLLDGVTLDLPTEESTEGNPEENTEDKSDNSGFTGLIFGGIALALLGVIYVFVFKRKKHTEDEDDDTDDEYLDEVMNEENDEDNEDELEKDYDDYPEPAEKADNESMEMERKKEEESIDSIDSEERAENEENEEINRDVNEEDIPDSIGSDGLEPEPDE